MLELVPFVSFAFPFAAALLICTIPEQQQLLHPECPGVTSTHGGVPVQITNSQLNQTTVPNEQIPHPSTSPAPSSIPKSISVHIVYSKESLLDDEKSSEMKSCKEQQSLKGERRRLVVTSV